MSPRIFLTGGTGFLGSHFLRLALQSGHEVYALRRGDGSPKCDQTKEPDWLVGGLTDDWSDELGASDSLVHLAATGVSPQLARWEELFKVNVLDSLTLWRKAAARGVRRFIICGSCFEYGASGINYDFIPPDAPLLPTTGYGASKAAASAAALALAVELELELVILRPFHMFGEGQHESNFWQALKRAALAGEDFPMTEGSQIRDFMPVEEAAGKFLSVLNRRDIVPGRPEMENVGSGRPQTLLTFAEHWWQHWKAVGRIRTGAIPLRTNEVMRYVPLLGNKTRFPEH